MASIMKPKAFPQVTLKQWKRQFGAGYKASKKEGKKDALVTQESHGLTSMFVPTKTDGNDFFEITTRKDFLNENIDHWLKWNMFRGLAVTFGMATLWLLTVHPLLAAAGGLAAGWAYGRFYSQDKTLDVLKKRDLFESV